MGVGDEGSEQRPCHLDVVYRLEDTPRGTRRRTSLAWAGVGAVLSIAAVPLLSVDTIWMLITGVAGLSCLLVGVVIAVLTRSDRSPSGLLILSDGLIAYNALEIGWSELTHMVAQVPSGSRQGRFSLDLYVFCFSTVRTRIQQIPFDVPLRRGLNGSDGLVSLSLGARPRQELDAVLEVLHRECSSRGIPFAVAQKS